MARTRALAGPGQAGSRKKLKQSLKSGNRSPNIKQIPSESEITVRLLEEPEEFYGYYEHWGKDGPFPCTDEDDGTGCSSEDDDERRRSFRYLANGYVVDDQKVMLIKLPKTLVETLEQFRNKYGTIMDRDYDLSRTGSGLDTNYFAAPDAPKRIKMDRFKLLDHEAALRQMLGEDADEEEDDDDEETPRRRSSTKKRTAPKSTRRSSPWEDDDDEDEDEDYDEDDDEEEKPRARRAVKKSAAKKTTRKVRVTSGRDEFHKDTTRNPSKTAGRKVSVRKTTTNRRRTR